MSASPAAPLGRYMIISLRNDPGSCFYVEERHWDEVDAAIHNHCERGIDRVLALVAISGADVLLPASSIDSISNSSPEIRERSREITAALKAEDPVPE